MGQLGIRQVSRLETPPKKRLPIKTHVLPYNEEICVQAIQAELDRGGQAFFLWNQVASIEAQAVKIKKLVPNAKVMIIHGQMKEHLQEKLILDFISGKSNVLVCTTIIESGIDIPNVNTLVVMDAQNFGLAQLYQIRGRVGRSPAQSYAYLFYPNDYTLSEEATARLGTIEAYQGLGAGFAIAQFDMDLRGVGNLIGTEQSGYVHQIGLELYDEMLKRAIMEIKGQPVPLEIDFTFKLQKSYHLDSEYINSESRRLSLYRSFFSAKDLAEIDVAFAETVDQWGPAHQSLKDLFHLAKIKFILGQFSCYQLVLGNKRSYKASLKDRKLVKASSLLTQKRNNETQISCTWFNKEEDSLDLIFEFREQKSEQKFLGDLVNFLLG